MIPDTVLEQAFAALAGHQPGPDGHCLACLADGAGPVQSPCGASREALAVVETHGVRHWDRCRSMNS